MSNDRKRIGSGAVKRSEGQLLEGHKVDIYFVIDTTGSMNNKIEALLQTCVQFVDVPAKYNLEANFLLVSFGDLKISGDRIVLEVPLTANIEQIKTGLNNINRNWGGGNQGESSFEAVVTALETPGRSGAVKAMVLITDEPAHCEGYSVSEIQGMLAEQQMLLYGLTPNIPYYRNLIKARGGQWVQISASSSLDMLKGLFEKLAQDLTETTREVIELTEGDVNEYLMLMSGED